MIYVAGPMTGLPAYNFPAFDSACAELRAVGHEACSPHEIALPCGCKGGPTTCGGPEHVWSDYLRNDLALLLREAQAVAVLDGWEASRGASLEVHVARALGLSVAPLARWLEQEPAAPAPAREQADPADEDEPRHEVECPSCGATIRARMADAPAREQADPADEDGER